MATRSDSDLDGYSKIKIKGGDVYLKISDDEMTSYITIPSPGEQAPEAEEVRSILATHRVIFGIDEERIVSLLENKEWNKPVLVAKGRPAILGQDAVIEFRFCKNPQGKPRIEEDGRINLHKLDLIENATVDQVLVVKTPASKGIVGKTVTDREIRVPDGKDSPLPAGRNTKISPDGLALVATLSGRVIWTGSRVNVEPIYEIKGNVDYSTGDIDFVGSLIVGGSITGGFTVKVGGDITVKGGIEMAEVTAGGNIIVSQGIMGKMAKVIAKGNIIAKYIETADVKAMGDVIVKEAIWHAHVDAEGQVILSGGKRGVLAGGRVRALKEINARMIGYWSEIPTEVEVGTSPGLLDEIARLERDLKKKKDSLRNLGLEINTLLLQRKSMGTLPPEKEELLSSHLQTQEILLKKFRDMGERRDLLKKECARDVGGKVSVDNVVYPGVRISIRTKTLEIKEIYKNTTFFVSDNKIELQPYEKPKIRKKGKDGKGHLGR